jgi:hypothetical protein
MCVFCGRDVLTRGHHIVPKSKGGRVIVPTCEACESFIHRTFSHRELRDTYNTVASIQAHDGYRHFLKWLLKQHPHAVFRTARNRTRNPDRYK